MHPSPEQRLTVTRILENAERYRGKDVTIRRGFFSYNGELRRIQLESNNGMIVFSVGRGQERCTDFGFLVDTIIPDTVYCSGIGLYVKFQYDSREDHVSIV